MKIFEQIINGIQIACIALMPSSAVCCLVLAYLNIGIKEGYTQEYAVGYCWVWLAISIIYDIVMIATTRNAGEMSK